MSVWERWLARDRRPYRRHRLSCHVAVCRTFACQPPCLVILRAIRLERSSGELMLAPVQLTSATRQNLWRLTFIRTLVLAAQAGSVGLAYWFDLLPLPWLQLAVTLGCSMVLCAFTAIRLRTSWPVTELEYAAATGLRSVYPQRLAVFLRWLDQPVRLLLPGAADHRRRDVAVALFGDSVGYRPGAVYLAAGAVLSAGNLPDRPGKPADLRHVAEFCPGRRRHHLLRRAHGRRTAPSGRAARHSS